MKEPSLHANLKGRGFYVHQIMPYSASDENSDAISKELLGIEGQAIIAKSTMAMRGEDWTPVDTFYIIYAERKPSNLGKKKGPIYEHFTNVSTGEHDLRLIE